MRDSAVFNWVISAPPDPIKVIAIIHLVSQVKMPRKEKSWKIQLGILENSWKTDGNPS